eukprot:TRINITY_DN1518_c0_g1_i2.p1 TRINITY_DN1518_c0_g1~~TRINITY_DN1518_c0_g1_i2.p1  ORF type:complete len:209 (-),score=28.77 TRINITY_DN1518_c0_g1_i2:95-721(-)
MSYIMEKGTREPEQMVKLREVTTEHPASVMMSAPEQACFFTMLMKLIGAKKTIEVGVFTGYSTLATALGLPEDGKVIALDISDEYTAIGRPYWKAAGVEGKIDLQIGPAAASLDKLIEAGGANQYDFAFVDADKPNYQLYYEKLLVLIKPGGLITIDNVLWSGRVVDNSVNDESTVAIRNLNAFISADKRVEIVMLPIGDGVSFVRKI